MPFAQQVTLPACVSEPGGVRVYKLQQPHQPPTSIACWVRTFDARTFGMLVVRYGMPALQELYV